MQHLKELRLRLIRCSLFLGLGFMIAYAFSKPLFRSLRGPFDQAYMNVFNNVPKLQNISLLEGFMVYLKVGLLGGFFISFPFIFKEMLGFVLSLIHISEPTRPY